MQNRPIKTKSLAKIQKIAFDVAVAAGCSINDLLARTGSEKNVFMRILLTKVALEKGISPYQVSLFLRKNHSAGCYYEKMYMIVRNLQKFKEMETKYYENQKEQKL